MIFVQKGDALNKILHNLDLVRVLGDGKLQKQKQSGATALTVAELKAELEARSIPTRGLRKKEDLLNRPREVLRDGEQVMSKIDKLRLLLKSYAEFFLLAAHNVNFKV